MVVKDSPKTVEYTDMTRGGAHLYHEKSRKAHKYSGHYESKAEAKREHHPKRGGHYESAATERKEHHRSAKHPRGGTSPRPEKGHPNKIHKVMHEFKHHELHSGSKHGPKVKGRSQAIAIALSEQRKANKGGYK